MISETIHAYWAEISAAAGAVIWFVRLEIAQRNALREVEMRLNDHDEKMLYMQTEAKTNSIQLTQILVELQAVKTGLEYIKAEMMRK
jgi:hypothetical protein